MRILCLIDSLGSGGAQRQVVGLAIMLKEQGYDVKVCYYHNIMFYEELLERNKVDHELIAEATSSLKRIPVITKYLKEESPDLVIAYQETPSLIASVAKLLGCKYKLIVSERNTTQKVRAVDKLRFFLYRRADYIVPNSFSQESFLIERYPWMKEKVKTIINFVDLNYFYPAVKSRFNKIPEILVAATIWPSKNTIGFIEAVSKLAADGLSFHVSWYGKNPAYIDYYNRCQELIDKHDVSKYIELKDKISEIKDKYQNADYFCLPSFYEGTPNVICEAMACGLPIVCSDVCDNGRYVKEGENGFLFNPKDVSSIYEAVKRVLILDRDEYKLYCQRSRAIAEKMFSKDEFVKSYLSLIE